MARRVSSQRTALHKAVGMLLHEQLKALHGYPALLEAVGSREEAEQLRLHLDRLGAMSGELWRACDDVQLRERDPAAEAAGAILWVLFGGLVVAFFWAVRGMQ